MKLEEVQERVFEVIAKSLDIDKEKVCVDANFRDDLKADSLDVMELVLDFEEEFGIEIPDDQAEKLNAVGDVITFLSENASAK